jgi:ABC-type dipeptide/oligopeptide/nickel transport system permease component
MLRANLLFKVFRIILIVILILILVRLNVNRAPASRFMPAYAGMRMTRSMRMRFIERIGASCPLFTHYGSLITALSHFNFAQTPKNS